MADRLVWAAVMRPQMPLVYLDINHFVPAASAASRKAQLQ